MRTSCFTQQCSGKFSAQATTKVVATLGRGRQRGLQVCCAMLYFLETSFLEARRCKALPASAPWPLCRAWQRKCSLAALAKPSRRLPAEVHLGSRNFRQPSRMEYQAALDRCTRFPSPFSSAQQRRPDRGSTSEELTGPTENQMHTAVRRC